MRNVIHKPSCTRYQMILFYFRLIKTAWKLCKDLTYYDQVCRFEHMDFLQHRAQVWFNFSISALAVSTLHWINKVTLRDYFLKLIYIASTSGNLTILVILQFLRFYLMVLDALPAKCSIYLKRVPYLTK